MRELDEDIPLADPESPRVEEVIRKMMKRFPGIGKASQARYYEEVHQELAPLARQLERELREARREALEEAAKICDEKQDWYEKDRCNGQATAVGACADEIRALAASDSAEGGA